MPVFGYDEKLLADYPAVRGGVLVVRGVKNSLSSDALLATYQAEQTAVITKMGDTAFGDLPTLAAWRSAFRAFGAEPTKHRSAAEALLRRLRKKGDIPSLNTLVDIGNLVSIRYGMPLAMFDSRAISGDLMVRYATGEERFTELGSGEVKHPEPGEVIFVDDAGLIYARRWCWRQSRESASREDTTDLVIPVEGHHATAATDAEAALNDLAALLAAYAGGEIIAKTVLGPDNPTVAF